MSDSTGPIRRRRIAGETKPAAPAKKAVARKPTTKKVAAKKAPVKKSDAKKAEPVASPVAKAAPVKAAPLKKTSVARAVPVKRTSVAKAVPVKKAPPESRVAAPKVTSAPRSTDTAGSGPGRRELTWLIPAALVAAAALVVGILLVVRGVAHVRDGGEGGDDLKTSQSQASSAASSAAETIFSFRYDQLDQHLAASKAFMTPSFSKDFDKIAPALTQLAPQRKIIVQAVAREAGVLSCGDECSATKANILVFVDQARLVGGSKQPTVFANRISVSMIKGKDGWRVNNIRAL